jgi:hypothetical protein
MMNHQRYLVLQRYLVHRQNHYYLFRRVHQHYQESRHQRNYSKELLRLQRHYFLEFLDSLDYQLCL